MKITRKRKIIAARLGVTASGMDYLARCVAKRRPPDRRESADMLLPLIRDGYLAGTAALEITASGRELVERARKMGW